MQINKKIPFLIFFAMQCLFGIIYTKEIRQNFIVETKRILIPNFQYVFNPSIVKWKNEFLMSFRIRENKTTNQIGLIWLDSAFNPRGKPYILKINETKPLSFFMEERGGPEEQDPRLITIEDDLYIVYSHYQVGKMFVSEVEFKADMFIAKNPVCLVNFEGSLQKQREKNWSPLVYNNNLLFEYSLSPHKILSLIPGTESCETITSTTAKISWEWGELRGGTPALHIDGNYLGFFHSSVTIPTTKFQQKKITYYFMGAYIFSSSFPFAITHVSPEPIVAKDFYDDHNYSLYKPLKVIFPGGFVFDDTYIYVFYGKHDNEVWYVKLSQKGLYESLVAV